MNSTFSRMGHLYRVMRRVFGLRVLPLMVGLMWSGLRAIIAVGMALDHVFFPKLRRVRANRPIVLVGNPRTGTTFLQRFLADKGFGCGMELFMMLYPSLIIQKIFRPFLPLLEKVSPAKFHATKAHDTNLSSVETDDVAVLFRYLDGFFLYGFFLAFDEPDHYLQFDPRVRDVSRRDFAWLDKLWRRSLVLHKSERNVAKLFSLSTRLPQFLKAFPRGPGAVPGPRSAGDHPQHHEPGHRRARSRLRLLEAAGRAAQALAASACTRGSCSCSIVSTRSGRAAPSTSAGSSWCATTA